MRREGLPALCKSRYRNAGIGLLSPYSPEYGEGFILDTKGPLPYTSPGETGFTVSCGSKHFINYRVGYVRQAFAVSSRSSDGFLCPAGRERRVMVFEYPFSE
jgi:hypothetical protein